MVAPRPPSTSRRSFGRRGFFERAGTAAVAAGIASGLNLSLGRVPTLFAADGNVEALVLSCNGAALPTVSGGH